MLIVSEAFEGKMTLARHRLGMHSCIPFSILPAESSSAHTQVNEALKAEIAQMHAFSQVRTSTISIDWPYYKRPGRANLILRAMLFFLPSLIKTTLTPGQWEARQQQQATSTAS